MAIYLDEDFFGNDDTTIGFPHLLLCMGFIAVVNKGGNKSMWGIHLTNPQASQRAFNMFAPKLLEQVDSSDIECIYGSCNWLIRYGKIEVSAWKSEMKSFARMLNFKGEALGFDTGIIRPRDGTYVQYDLDPLTDKCRIYYRQNDRMVFSRGNAPLGNKIVFGSNNKGISKLPEHLRERALAKTRDRVEEESFSTSGIERIKKGKGLFAKGILREVDYAQRLVRVYVA